MRREVTDFYRAVHPLLGPLDALERGAYSQVCDKLLPFFRDVNDLYLWFRRTGMVESG